MVCPVCSKRVLKGRAHAHQRAKVYTSNRKPRLIHKKCLATAHTIKRMLEATKTTPEQPTGKPTIINQQLYQDVLTYRYPITPLIWNGINLHTLPAL